MYAQMPLINAHANVSKVRYSMGYFDSENPDEMSLISSESALLYMQRKKYKFFGKL